MTHTDVWNDSLHCNGHTLLSAGLDCQIQLWDVRKLKKDNRSGRSISPLAHFHFGKSVNSAHFSPSGKRIVATTQANKLDLFQGAHLQSGLVQPYKRIVHDNHTGRWLSTFMTEWHPTLDVFAVGSMRRPRCIEVFDGSDGRMLQAVSGEALTAVASRLAWHPTQMWLAGGNSSGRVTVVS